MQVAPFICMDSAICTLSSSGNDGNILAVTLQKKEGQRCAIISMKSSKGAAESCADG